MTGGALNLGMRCVHTQEKLSLSAGVTGRSLNHPVAEAGTAVRSLMPVE
jgi:hypothetical protein